MCKEEGIKKELNKTKKPTDFSDGLYYFNV
jgi:hypothetical protein